MVKSRAGEWTWGQAGEGPARDKQEAIRRGGGVVEDTGSSVQGGEWLERPHCVRSRYLKTPGQEGGKETGWVGNGSG